MPVESMSPSEENYEEQEAKIVIAKKKMTRSIFTIDEEAMESGTIVSSKTNGWGADFENSHHHGPKGEIESIQNSQYLNEGHS